jgi:hypothetical protein
MKWLGVAAGLALTAAVGANLLFSSLGAVMLLLLVSAVVGLVSPRSWFTVGFWALRAPWLVLPAVMLAILGAAGCGALVTSTGAGLLLSYLGPAVSLGGLGFLLSSSW